MGAEVLEAEAELGQEVGGGASESGLRSSRRPGGRHRRGGRSVDAGRAADGRIDERDLGRPPRGPMTATRLSVRWTTFTSRRSKRSPILTKTWFLPFFSNTAWRGTWSASATSWPSMTTRADDPAFSRGSGSSNWNVTSNCRLTLEDLEPVRRGRPARDSAPDRRVERRARQRVDVDRRRADPT